MTFYYWSIVTMGLSCTVSEICGNFGWKCNFCYLGVWCLHWEHYHHNFIMPVWLLCVCVCLCLYCLSQNNQIWHSNPHIVEFLGDQPHFPTLQPLTYTNAIQPRVTKFGMVPIYGRGMFLGLMIPNNQRGHWCHKCLVPNTPLRDRAIDNDNAIANLFGQSSQHRS